MRMTVKLKSDTLTRNLIKVKHIKEVTDNLATMEVCDMFILLCQEISEGIVEDSTAKIMNRRAEEYHDSSDDPDRHSIAGHMNDPSEMQMLGFKKENEDDG